ncbi:MAG: hypothetical protein Q9M36_03745 [Sulfurovum sp.]|nr:hypothetical protein [Sulfurovum sp.]
MWWRDWFDEDNKYCCPMDAFEQCSQEVTATTIGTWYYHRWKIEAILNF